MFNLITFLSVVILAYFVGTMIESRHYQSIKARERALLNIPVVVDEELLEKNREVENVRLVCGSVVISVDYFKRLLAGLRNLIGGELSSYETLLDRARREAILRMKEEASNADIILNLRLETAEIGGGNVDRKGIGSVEVVAYGSAVTLKKLQ